MLAKIGVVSSVTGLSYTKPKAAGNGVFHKLKRKNLTGFRRGHY
jgi:hypothetical protein